MSPEFSKILKKLFLSSVASIAANNTVVASPYSAPLSLDDDENELITNKENDLSPKLLLKLNNNNEWTAVSHRSHRSHSSHRSHYSSTTSTGTTTTRPNTNSSKSSVPSYIYERPNTSSSPSTTQRSNTNRSFNSNNSQKQSISSSSSLKATSLKLGDRNLKLGMSGSDVTELINILLKKGYLELNNGELRVTGIYEYDQMIEATVKRFQKNNNLSVDGNCGPVTVYYLLNK